MNKASRGDGIPVELFQILKDDAVNVLHSNASKVMLKILQARTMNFQMFKLVLEKAEEPEIKSPTSVGS